jgi:hypothetical protein
MVRKTVLKYQLNQERQCQKRWMIMAEPNTAATRLHTHIISALNIPLQANAELNSSPEDKMVRKMMSASQSNPTKQCQAEQNALQSTGQAEQEARAEHHLGAADNGSRWRADFG